MEGMQNYKSSLLPDAFTVGVYYSDDANMNYFNPARPTDDNDGRSNTHLLFEVAKAMPTVKFKFFGGMLKQKEANMEFCGKIPYENMPEFIKSCSMIVRPTVHDGFPHLPIQFLLSGRSALVSYPAKDMPYTQKLSFGLAEKFSENIAELCDKIYKIRDNGILYKYEEIEKYYRDLLDVDTYRKNIQGLVQ